LYDVLSAKMSTYMATDEHDRPLMSEHAKSVISKALAVACPQCQASAGELCKRLDGQRVEHRGHLGVHLPRLIAARVVLGANA
jgi:hypothetical protein